MDERPTGGRQLSLSQTGKFSLQEYTPAIFVPMWDCSPLFPRHSQMQTGTTDAVMVTGRGGILQWQLLCLLSWSLTFTRTSASVTC